MPPKPLSRLMAVNGGIAASATVSPGATTCMRLGRQTELRVSARWNPSPKSRVPNSASNRNHIVPTAPSERKLTAVVVADVVGYSRLTAEDEEGTIDRLRRLRSEIVDPAVARYRGRLIKTLGDGFLIEFASVVDAVRSSLEIQQRLGDEEGSIQLRVGIHISDVIVEPDGDLLGDGVNIAARLQAIADPGTICLSEDAFHQVRDKISVKTVDKGEVVLKNMPRPVRVYALHGGPARMALPTGRLPQIRLRTFPSLCCLSLIWDNWILTFNSQTASPKASRRIWHAFRTRQLLRATRPLPLKAKRLTRGKLARS